MSASISPPRRPHLVSLRGDRRSDLWSGRRRDIGGARRVDVPRGVLRGKFRHSVLTLGVALHLRRGTTDASRPTGVTIWALPRNFLLPQAQGATSMEP